LGWERMKVTVLAAVVACVAAATSPAVSAESGSSAPPGGSFSASTAGLPVGAAVGGWSDETDGRSGDLTVDFASAPADGRTTFEAQWTSDTFTLEQSDQPYVVSDLIAGDIAHNPITETLTDVSLDTRVAKNGSWSEWSSTSSRTVNNRQRNTDALLFGRAIVTPDCDCRYQVQFRFRGTKTGLDASQIFVDVDLTVE
jgi:hypothetical protein